VEFEKAVKNAADLNDAAKKKAAEEGLHFASSLAQAGVAGAVDDEIKWFGGCVDGQKEDATVQALLGDAKRRKAQGGEEADESAEENRA